MGTCVQLHASFCGSTWIWRPFPPLPLARLYAACAGRRGEGNPKAPRLRARRPHPGQGTGCGAGPGGPGGTTEPLPRPLLPCKVGCWGRQRAGKDAGRAGSTQWSSFACTFCGQGRIRPSCEPSLHPRARDQTCLRTGLPQPSMGRVCLSHVWWLFPPLRGGLQPGAMPPVLAEPVAQDAGEWVHLPSQGDGWVWDMGILTLGLAHATSLCKGGTLVPRHWGGHPSRIDAGGKGTRVWPLFLRSDQR